MSISECDDLITTRIVLVSAIQIQDRVCRLSESVVVTNLSDSYIHLEPFIDNLAFNSTTDQYCAFGTQSDVMLASLQLFNHVPTRIMDLVIFMVTHPNFDRSRAGHASRCQGHHPGREEFDPLPPSIRCLDLCFEGPLAFVRLSELYSEEENRAPNALGRLPRNLVMFKAGEYLYGRRINKEVWLEHLLGFPFSARFPLIESLTLRFHLPDRYFEDHDGANTSRDKMETIVRGEGFLSSN